MAELNHDALVKMITEQQWWFGASELHGILSALCSLNQARQWSSVLAMPSDDAPGKQLIPELLQHIDTRLQGSDLSFRLLLPENVTLAERAEALRDWAQGFSLASLFLREKHLLMPLSEEGQEFLHDLSEIQKLDYALQDSEENQQLLTDLEEHCRLGSLLLFAETHQK